MSTVIHCEAGTLSSVCPLDTALFSTKPVRYTFFSSTLKNLQKHTILASGTLLTSLRVDSDMQLVSWQAE